MTTTHNPAQRRGAFPERLAFVNLTEIKRGYEMKYVKEEAFSNGGIVKNGQTVELLRYTMQCEVWEATLLVTPYIRVIEGDGQWRGRLVFRVDGEVVVDGPIERHLVADMESPILDVPMTRPPGAALCYASYVDKDGSVPDKSVYGIMAPNGSVLELEIKDSVLSKDGYVKVEAGCIAALYTTKI